MKSSSETSRLEDFGAKGIVSPRERLKEYQEQSKGLPKKVQAKFWLGILERDPEVRKLVRSRKQEGMGLGNTEEREFQSE